MSDTQHDVYWFPSGFMAFSDPAVKTPGRGGTRRRWCPWQGNTLTLYKHFRDTICPPPTMALTTISPFPLLLLFVVVVFLFFDLPFISLFIYSLQIWKCLFQIYSCVYENKSFKAAAQKLSTCRLDEWHVLWIFQDGRLVPVIFPYTNAKNIFVSPLCRLTQWNYLFITHDVPLLTSHIYYIAALYIRRRPNPTPSSCCCCCLMHSLITTMNIFKHISF